MISKLADREQFCLYVAVFFHSYNFTFPRNVRVFILFRTTDQSEVALLKTTSQ